METEFLVSAYRPDQYPPAQRPEIAFAGRSNVGKSSLINVLINRKGLAKTSSRPGRTQSINFIRVGNQLNFVDLPGYGFARVPEQVKRTWGPMIETYLLGRSVLRGAVVILDIRRGIMAGDGDLLDWLQHHHIPALVVLTKADKLPRQQLQRRLAQVRKGLHQAHWKGEPMAFSAKTRLGKEQVWAHINRLAQSGHQLGSHA